jgi:formylglycine-generating enzyme required for sulfatase activity
MKLGKHQHPIIVDGFFMEITEVAIAQFLKFDEENCSMMVVERDVV